jgi:hypothetical protein
LLAIIDSRLPQPSISQTLSFWLVENRRRRRRVEAIQAYTS